jgi:hypothetical protein
MSFGFPLESLCHCCSCVVQTWDVEKTRGFSLCNPMKAAKLFAALILNEL